MSVRRKHHWTTSYAYSKAIPMEFTVHGRHVEGQHRADSGNQHIAVLLQSQCDRLGKGKLEFEDFSDEIHAFFRDNADRRRRFANVQYEGPA